jgi:hypothetical protein
LTTGYIKLLEDEDIRGLLRIENLRELVNAAMDSRDRGESSTSFSTMPLWSAMPTSTTSGHRSRS